MVLFENCICAIRAQLNGAWTPSVYLARVIEFEEDENDNWSIVRVRIIGEGEDRLVEDDNLITGVCRIPGDDKQELAEKLVVKNWGQLKAYKDYDEIRTAILEAA